METIETAATPPLTKRRKHEERLREQALNRERKRALEREIMDFPVFQQAEVLPLKYYIHKDIYQAVKKRRAERGEPLTVEEKDTIKAEIQRILKIYCRSRNYCIAAMVKQKRYHLDGTEEYGICRGDMGGFVNWAKMHEKARRRK